MTVKVDGVALLYSLLAMASTLKSDCVSLSGMNGNSIKSFVRELSNRTNLTHLLVGVSMVLTAVVYLQVVDAPFYRDDAAHIAGNTALHNPASLTDLLQNANNGMSRYLTVVVYHLAWKAGDGKSWPYHGLSLLFHLLNGVLVFSLLRKAVPKMPWLAALTTTVFLLHPMQINPVIYASKLTVVMSTFFLLCGLLVAARAPRDKEPVLAIFFLTLLAVLSKEITVFLPVLVILYRWQVCGISIKQMRRRDLVGYMGTFVGLLALALVLNQVIRQPSFGLQVQSSFEYFFTQMYNGWRYLLLVFFITPPSHIHPHPNFDLSIGLHGLAFLVCFAIAVFFMIKHLRPRGVATFFILLFVIMLAPTHSLIPKRTAFAEYQFYLPNLATYFLVLLAGWQLIGNLVGQLYGRLVARFAGVKWPQYHKALPGVVMALLLVPFLFSKSIVEIDKWHDPLDLVMSSFKQYPRDSVSSCIMAEKASSCGEPELASDLTLDYFKREHDYYRYSPKNALRAKFNFLMKKGENKELLRHLRIARDKYKTEKDIEYYQYFLYALRANHLRGEYQAVLSEARKSYPGQRFMGFLEQLPIQELIKRDPEFWGRVH